MSLINLAKVDFGGCKTGASKPEVKLTETIVENGLKTFNPPAGSVYSSATIDVQVPLPVLEDNKTQTISSNGDTVIVPTDGNDGMKKATVTVNVPSDKKPEEVLNETVTENGLKTFNPTQGSVYSSATIDVQVPLPVLEDNKTQSITTNGQTVIVPTTGNDAMEQVTVDVQVPTPEPKPEIKLTETITENGLKTFNPPAGSVYSSAEITVNVPSSGGDENHIVIDSAPNSMKGPFWNLNIYVKKLTLPENMDNVTNMVNAFSDCSSLTSITLPALPNVTTMSGCFSNCSSLTSITLPALPKVTDMEMTFNNCISLTSISLPELSNVTNMERTFINCSSLTSISLPELPNVITMRDCFSSCSSLPSISLPELPNVTRIDGCFWECRSLTSISLPALPKVTNMRNCFYNCKTLLSISLPDLANVTNMNYCFYLCDSLHNLTISSIGDTITSLTDWTITSTTVITKDSLNSIIAALPDGTPTSKQRTCTIGTTNLAKLTPEEIQVATAKNWTLN